ncbi:acyl-CoA dehydrogenase family protein [Asanoa iriomotensis]|uniref:Acyl-CoA dehydrogenase n=1 Tax=Asanoa iriomotensis TaxID=234613 RepID=A0ABQ4C7A5_9ACTN|nr:acyl-CoA dehydrogenase family protein [Asanoa iriomotensis]GIF58195.1 acyl-CoA dehydrogenase [Asanoa iriomotensis]
MAEFRLSAEHQRFATWARATAAEHIAPLARHDGRVNRPLLREMGARGLLRAVFGGTAEPDQAAALQLCLLREAIAQVSGEAETALALQGLGSYPILQSGTRDLAARWIPPIAAGEAVAAFALSEPGAGSDAAALELRAEPDGQGWRLTGEKTWISNAPDADIYSVFARTTPGTRSKGVTAFAVPGDSAGLTGEPIDMLSPHPIGHLTFDGVRVGPESVLGEVDDGFAVAMRTLDLFRPSVGAYAVGMAQAALDTTVEHVKTRQVHGAPLARQQAVAHRIADMVAQLEAGRLLVYAAAAAYDAGDEPQEQTRRSAIAKLFATEAAQQIVDGCVQLHGAVALRSGHLLEQLYRDVRSLRIYEGASEIQRTIIAREVIGIR